MTPTPIPASLATACAAHDRHRLDVLDALLDEAAPSAVRELLGAALDLCASLRTERDELRARLDAAPKVCAIHSYEHGPGPCMTCGAWPPGTREMIASLRTDLDSERDTAAALRSEIAATCAEWNVARQSLASERAHLAACRTRIAGLESAANERSAEVAKRDAEIADLRALVESQRRDYLDVCDAIAPETSGPADAAAKVRALRAKLAEAKRLGRDACELAKAYADDAREYGGDTAAADAIAAALEAL